MPEDPLTNECQVYARYLMGRTPSAYVCDKYQACHQLRPAVLTPRPGSFDRVLVRLSRRGPWLARLADAYARFFVRGTTLRNKLVLLLAILESSSPEHEELDRVDRGGRALLWIRLAALIGAAAATALAAVILLAPCHIAWVLAAKLRRSGPRAAPLLLQETDRPVLPAADVPPQELIRQ